jgi:nitronate monooxygenase
MTSRASIRTRLTDRFNLRHPIISAPMALAAGGKLAAAVSAAGCLGLIGGGYGDGAWLDEQFAAAGNQPIGCGFITWSLAKQPHLLDQALARRPAAVMLSFGDPAPFAPAIAAMGVPLIAQCQTMAHVAEAIAAGASVIVAQGGEAGGHGMSRGTLNFVPEVADRLAVQAPEVLLIAAGGIADGRGLAAALMLGADGVLVGTRLWASREALVHPDHHAAILAADGDATLRTTTPDIARRLEWPEGFTARIRRNGFTDRWHGRESDLKATADTESDLYKAAFIAGDVENAGVWFGEAAGLIHSIETSGAIVERMAAEARARLDQRFTQGS